MTNNAQFPQNRTMTTTVPPEDEGTMMKSPVVVNNDNEKVAVPGEMERTQQATQQQENSSSPSISSSPDPSSLSRQSKNAGRWKILRDAILSASNNSNSSSKEPSPNSITENKTNNASSIHRFEGYNLLKPTPLVPRSSSTTNHKQEGGRENEYEDKKKLGKDGVSSKAMNTANPPAEIVMESLLTRFEFEWNIETEEDDGHDSERRDEFKNRSLVLLDRLEIAILALAAYCSPKGKCMTVAVTTTVSRRNKNIEDQIPSNTSDTDMATISSPTSSFSDGFDWFTKLKQRLNGEEEEEEDNNISNNTSPALPSRPSPPAPVFVIKLDEKQKMTTTTTTNVDDGTGTTVTTVTTITTTQILVQESSNRKSTKYCVQRYDLSLLSSNEESNVPETTQARPSLSSSTQLFSSSLSLCTREPRTQNEVKLSLSDLVSHRYNQGVDNTGNICVWDSEGTLSFLLCHHWNDFHIKNLNNIDSMINNSNDNSIDGQRVRILELGTGMAGLSGVALGLRLAATTFKLMMSMHPPSSTERKIIDVMLTDGNPTGVKNNMINQYLTSMYGSAQQQQQQQQLHRQNHHVADNKQDSNNNGSQQLHPYSCLDVKCQKLLWTTDLPEPDIDSTLSSSTTTNSNYDIVLISDCTHFQNFHAALAVTSLRSLKVGGTAIFCQPSRGKSLDNFCKMIESPSEYCHDLGPLISTRWLPQCHPILEENHQEALRKYAGTDVYDESLHRPKIWIVTKLREITKEDQQRFVSIQESR